MKDRLLYNFVIGTIIQLILYVGILLLIKIILENVTRESSVQITDYGLFLSIITYSIIIASQNLISVLINLKWINWILVAIASGICLIGWGEDWNTWPIRTTVYIVIGLGLILTKPILDKKINRTSVKKT